MANRSGRPLAMPDELFTFLWRVPAAGLAWRDLTPAFGRTARRRGARRPGSAGTARRDPPDRFLTDGVPVGGLQMVKFYAPLKDEPALFKTFADTEPTEEGILAFANRYGLLGPGADDLGEFVELLGPEGAFLGYGERFSIWAAEIEALKEMERLREAAVNGDMAYLRACILWDRDGKAVRYERPDGRGGGIIATEVAGPGRLDDRLRWLTPGDLALPALFYVQTRVNKKLAGHASPRLLYGERRDGRRRSVEFALHVVPTDLLGALWLELALAVAEKREYRRCAQCGKWFAFLPDKTRPDRKYCSDACKSRAWRERHREKGD